MENKKMSCWDFVFSSVKTHIDDLVRQADKYIYRILRETLNVYMGHRTKRILRIERKEYQTY